MKQENGNKACHICHINAQNIAYLTSYRVFRLKCLKYAQNLDLKKSRTQELNYIKIDK